MPWDGNGNFTRKAGSATGSDTWKDLDDDAVRIRSDLMDEHDQDLALGINNGLTIDGQNSPTANLPMGNAQFDSVADGTARDEYCSISQYTNGSLWFAGTSTSSSDAYAVSLTPAITAYVDGMFLCFRVDTANTTTTPTLNVNGVGAITIAKTAAALAAGDLALNRMAVVIYRESPNIRFQLLNPGS